jgi:hypothetical protein
VLWAKLKRKTLSQAPEYFDYGLWTSGSFYRTHPEVMEDKIKLWIGRIIAIFGKLNPFREGICIKIDNKAQLIEQISMGRADRNFKIIILLKIYKSQCKNICLMIVKMRVKSEEMSSCITWTDR